MNVNIKYFMYHLGMTKILLGRGPNKESAFLDVTPIHLEVKLKVELIFLNVFRANFKITFN